VQIFKDSTRKQQSLDDKNSSLNREGNDVKGPHANAHKWGIAREATGRKSGPNWISICTNSCGFLAIITNLSSSIYILSAFITTADPTRSSADVTIDRFSRPLYLRFRISVALEPAGPAFSVSADWLVHM
jgi:hypothetical protein